MAEEKEKESGWGTVLGILIIFFFGMLLGIWICEEMFRREAVEHGAARWVPKDAYGNTKFEWVKPSVDY